MIYIHPFPPLAEVEAAWRSLESVARHSFFLSWPWIRTWLTCLPADVRPQLMLISEGGLTIAAALMVRRTLRRRKVLPTRTWALNSTGDPSLDQIFIEYNGLLARTDSSARAWKTWADCFIRDHRDWDELQLRGVAPSVLGAWNHPTTQLREEMLLVARYVDLDEVRSRGSAFLESMGKKKRARIRYTKRTYEKYGQILLEVAQTKQQALHFFAELKVLHQQRWTARKGRGAFDYPFFEHFHLQLIEGHFDDGVIQLLRVRAGDRIVGVLYNFVHDNAVVVYQTGFNYKLMESANRESPGLLTHVMAVDYNLAQGHNRYDLLAGDSEYKRALSEKSEQLWWGRVQRRRLKFRAEDGLKTAWKYVAKEVRDVH